MLLTHSTTGNFRPESSVGQTSCLAYLGRQPSESQSAQANLCHPVHRRLSRYVGADRRR